MKSSTPVTVTVWGWFQFPGLKTRDVTDSEPSDGSVTVRSTRTADDGRLVRATVKVAVPPASVVSGTDAGVITTPAMSLSALTADTRTGARVAYNGSRLPPGSAVIVNGLSPSA